MLFCDNMKYLIIFLSSRIREDQKGDINRLKGVISSQHDYGYAHITHVDQKLIERKQKVFGFSGT